MRSGTESRIAGALAMALGGTAKQDGRRRRVPAWPCFAGPFPRSLAACILAAATFSAACSSAGADAGERVESVGQQATAPSWMLDIDDHGTWTQEDEPDVVHAWLNARVANVRYHKRVLVEVAAPYDGAWMRTMHVAQYRGPLGEGTERWGADTIEIYPEGGPWGATLDGPVMARVRFQHDLDNDGQDEMVTTSWQKVYGQGDPEVPSDDPWAPGLTSPVDGSEAEGEPSVLWSPYDDPGQEVVARIDAIIAAQRANPDERHTLHAAVFNITDPGIVDKLIEAHQAGVELRLVFDGRKFRPWYDWYDGDDRLLAAGVPLLGVCRPGGAMHDKMALFDGTTMATGSFNWEWGARYENHEAMLVTDRRDLMHAYANRFEAIAGGVQHARAFAEDVRDPVSVSFAPDEEPYRIVGNLIDAAAESIHVAMFTAKDVVYQEYGRETSILRKLVAAHDRGVRVTVIVDQGIHEASEYHGVLSEDDQTDEWLESQGVTVVRADNPNGSYASMHHKYAVIDGEVAVLGAFNWYYDAAFKNDEDQIVWRNARLAADLDAEFVDMLRRYDPAFDASAWPSVTLRFDAHCDGTAWGEVLRVVGDDPRLGAWEPMNGLALDASSWPRWHGDVTVPRGARMNLKLVVTNGSGQTRWESGGDRHVRAVGDGEVVEVPMSYR